MPEELKLPLFFLLAAIVIALFVWAIVGFLYRLVTGRATCGDWLDMLFFWWPFR